MASPTAGPWSALQRLCRYLVGLPRIVYSFNWQVVDAIDVYTDTEWTGCPRTRKSTSGGVVCRGQHTISWLCKFQSNIALSSCVAELYASLKGAVVGLIFQILPASLVDELPLELLSYACSPIGVLL